MPDVRWSAGALADLDAIGVYLDRSSPSYARSLVRRLYQSAEVLVDHPHLGRIVPETEIDHVRELLREGYRIVYVVLEQQIDVLAVLHSRQDLRRTLRRD